MSDVNNRDRIDRLQKKKDEIAHKINEKVSGEVWDFQNSVNRSLKENREALRNYYLEKMEEELNEAENTLTSGNITSAMTHKMQADMYSFMLRSL